MTLPRPHVVVVGAGFGGLAAARTLADQDVDVTIVDRNNFHTFQPLLYQVATAGLNAADVAYVVRGIFQDAQRVDFRQGRVTGVDLDDRRVDLEDEEPLHYDHLVIAAGSTTNYFGIEGAAEHAWPLYSLEDATALRNHLLARFEEADADPSLIDEGALTFVVVGGGPTGVEVAGALAELIEMVLRKDFHRLDVRRSRIVLVEQLDHLLAPFGPESRAFARRALEARGVETRLGESVARISDGEVELGSGEVIRARTLVWGAGVRANPLADLLGLPQGRGGRVTVRRDLSLPGHPEVFVVGDMADIDDGRGDRLPQLAQVAIQGGRHAAGQIGRDRDGRPRRPFRYVDKGTMATIGRRAAVAEVGGRLRFTGTVAWVVWLVLHIFYLLGMRNRVSVLLNWAWNYLTWDRGPRLIFESGRNQRNRRDRHNELGPDDEGTDERRSDGSQG